MPAAPGTTLAAHRWGRDLIERPHPKRDRFLAGWARLVCARPWLTIVVCALLAAGSVAYTAARLEFKSDRSDLVDPTTPWQQRYAAFKQAFPRWDDAVVVVDLNSAPDPATGEAFIAALESRLLADAAHFKAVTAGFDRQSAPAGLIYVAPVERVREAVGGLKKAAPVLFQPSLPGLLSLAALDVEKLPILNRFADQLRSPEAASELKALLERIAACEIQSQRAPSGSERGRVGDAVDEISRDPLAAGRGSLPSVLGTEPMVGVQRLTTSTERLATLLVSLRTQNDKDVDGRGGAISALRGHIRDLQSEPRFAAIKAGVTGVPVLESDETVQSTRDASLAGIVSLVLIAGLMLIVYRGFVVPMLAVVSLLAGMALSFAWATLVVGHLQLLSVTFASMLLGLGIDVAIHIIARLELVHPDHAHLEPAIEETFKGVGPGILTASITVAAAAGAMAFTSFSGVGEMGIIAAGGIILCTLVIMSLFPAMLMVIKNPERRLLAHNGGVSRPFMGRFGVAFHRRAGLVAIGAVVVFAAAGVIGSRVRYDPDLQKLLPTGTESVVWQDALEADDAKSVWHAVVVAKDEAEARDLTLKLRALPEVADVSGAGVLFSSDEVAESKRAMLRGLPKLEHEHWIAESLFAPPESMLAELRASAKSIATAWQDRDAKLADAARRVSELSDDGATRAIRSYMSDRRLLHGAVAALSAAEPPSVNDLPQALRDTMLGTDGELLLRVYPKVTSRAATEPSALSTRSSALSPLAPERLNPFARAVLAVAPRATGPTVQIYESTRLITNAYAQAGVYALLVIIILLLFDFGLTRSGVLDTLCALVPVLGGAVLLLAWMVIASIELNFANMIVMPLIVGIGVGCGVHCVRRWRLQPNDEPLGLAGGSGRGMTLTTLTTVIGFATMTIAQHRGIQSLGFVMSVGLMMVWGVTILVLPALLTLRTRLKV